VVPKSPPGTVRPSPRERLLAAADELFYADGVQSVGIDRILERAGVAKASMYKAFSGKEELAAAYLDARHRRIVAEIQAAVYRESDPRARLLAVFDAQARWISRPSYRGCAFARASAEATPGGLLQQASNNYRREVLGLLTRLATEAGVVEAATLGLQLHLLYNGVALLEAEHLPGLVWAARSAAETLLDAALHNRDAPPCRSHP
jgi:AcrR family transcriptional regulator